MRLVTLAAAAALLSMAAAEAARAADPTDPDWPCIQRKVEHLSLAVMWPDPVPEDAGPLAPDLEEAAARLALRRVSEEDARAILDRVAADHPDLGPEGYGILYREVFDRIDRQRAAIMGGIGRYARNQERVAAEIEGLRSEMAALEAAEETDFDRLDAVEAEIDWRVRIFGDRNRALTYVCESPVLLEQRAYAIARLIAGEAG